MNSIILRVATKFLIWLILLFSLFILWRGHNEPGGGFSGGLIAASGFSLYLIAYGTEATRRLIRIDLRYIIAIGLIFALSSGLISFLSHKPFLSGIWFTLPLTDEKLGTPILFDIGVYCVVLGSILMIILALEET
ncbi:MAG: Na+/H+ antiporter subunit B [Pseudomonadota bacterium]